VEEASRIAPDLNMVLKTRAQLAYLRGDHKAATVDGQRLLGLTPEDVEAHYLVGHMLAREGDYQAAARHLHTAARHEPDNEEYVSSARWGRYGAHPLLLPLWPVRRFGQVRVWLGSLAIIVLAGALGMETLAGILLIVYLFYCIYTWVVPPLIQSWLKVR
jgi:tetratricopeptide (TPR) repeat protein